MRLTITCGGCGGRFVWLGGTSAPRGAVCLACFERNEREIAQQRMEAPQ